MGSFSSMSKTYKLTLAKSMLVAKGLNLKTCSEAGTLP